MKAQVSFRTATLNNDYYEVVKSEKRFGGDNFELARDKAYEELDGSQLSVFATMDEESVYVGCWFNVAYLARQSATFGNYERTNRVGANETKSCVSLKIPVEEMRRFKGELVIGGNVFYNVFKTLLTDEVWNSEQWNLITVDEYAIELEEVISDRVKPIYDVLYKKGIEQESMSIHTANHAMFVINAILNNMVEWNAKDYSFVAYVPSNIDKKIDVNSTHYLITYASPNKVVNELKRECKKKGYNFDDGALKEIAEAGRFNLMSAKLLLEKIAKQAGKNRVSTEICIRLLIHNHVGYDGFTKDDIITLELLKNGVEIPKIREKLNMDEVRFDNQILNFLLNGDYIKSNGKKITVKKNGEEVLFGDSLIRSFIEEYKQEDNGDRL